jgi:hypothetical protein
MFLLWNDFLRAGGVSHMMKKALLCVRILTLVGHCSYTYQCCFWKCTNWGLLVPSWKKTWIWSFGRIIYLEQSLMHGHCSCVSYWKPLYGANVGDQMMTVTGMNIISLILRIWVFQFGSYLNFIPELKDNGKCLIFLRGIFLEFILFQLVRTLLCLQGIERVLCNGRLAGWLCCLWFSFGKAVLRKLPVWKNHDSLLDVANIFKRQIFMISLSVATYLDVSWGIEKVFIGEWRMAGWLYCLWVLPLGNLCSGSYLYEKTISPYQKWSQSFPT